MKILTVDNDSSYELDTVPEQIDDIQLLCIRCYGCMMT